MTANTHSIKPAPAISLKKLNSGAILIALYTLFSLSIHVNAEPLSASLNSGDTSQASIETLSETIGAQEIQALTLAFAKQALGGAAANGRIEYSSVPMDSRLSLRRCSQALSFEPQKSNARAGRKLIKVRCEDHKPWAIFVPVNFDHWQTVVSARLPIQRNEVISANDIELKELKLGGIANDYLLDTSDAIGKLATRAIEIGKPLSKRGLAQAKWIKRGDEVVIVANSYGVSASMPGTAMADGSKGQQITVRNRSSNRMIKARVVAPGKVETIM